MALASDFNNSFMFLLIKTLDNETIVLAVGRKENGGSEPALIASMGENKLLATMGENKLLAARIARDPHLTSRWRAARPKTAHRG